MLLPCLEMCDVVDRACSSFVWFTRPKYQLNAAARHDVGYIGSADGEEGQDVTGGSQDM